MSSGPSTQTATARTQPSGRVGDGRSRLAQRVADRLFAMITSGAFEPAARLPTEPELAAMTGVSRMTLREAVRLLQAKGVVSVEHGRGTFVRPMSDWFILDPAVMRARAASERDADEIFGKVLEARRLVEVGVAGLAATRRTARHVTEMRAALNEMRRGVDAGAIETFTAADVAFHQAVMRAAGNEVIAAFFMSVEGLVLESRRRTSEAAEARAHAVAAHAAILAAIEVGDPAEAHRAMDAHLAQTFEDAGRPAAATDAGRAIAPAAVDDP